MSDPATVMWVGQLGLAMHS